MTDPSAPASDPAGNGLSPWGIALIVILGVVHLVTPIAIFWMLAMAFVTGAEFFDQYYFRDRSP